MADENTLEFIIKMRDEATATLKNITGELAEHVDAHTGLAEAAGASGAALNTVADASLIAATGQGTASAAAADHAGALEAAGDTAVETQTKLATLFETVLGATSVNDVLRQMEVALHGVSNASATIKTETLLALDDALGNVGNKAAIIHGLEQSLTGVASTGQAIKLVSDAVADVAGQEAIVATVSSRLTAPALASAFGPVAADIAPLASDDAAKAILKPPLASAPVQEDLFAPAATVAPGLATIGAVAGDAGALAAASEGFSSVSTGLASEALKEFSLSVAAATDLLNQMALSLAVRNTTQEAGLVRDAIGPRADSGVQSTAHGESAPQTVVRGNPQSLAGDGAAIPALESISLPESWSATPVEQAAGEASAGVDAAKLTEATAAAQGTSEAVKEVGEASTEAEGHTRSWIATLLGVETANEAFKQLIGALGGVNEKTEAIKSETVLYLTEALQGTAGGAQALERLEGALEGVSTKAQAVSAAKTVLTGLGDTAPIIAGLTSHLAEVSGKTEEAVLAMRLSRLAAEQAGEGMREFSAEAGIAGEVLKQFGGSGLIVGLGIAAVTAAVADGIKSFAEYQLAAERFSTNQANTGRDYSFEEMHSFSEDQSDDSTFSTAELDQAQEKIAAFPDLSKQATQEVLKDAMDMAAGTGQDIVSVAQTLGRAFNEPLLGAQLLRRQLRDISPDDMAKLKAMDVAGNTSGERELLSSKVEELYGGQSEAMNDTLAGSFEIAGKGLAEFVENGLTLVGALADSFGVLGGAVRGVGRGLASGGDLFSEVTNSLVVSSGEAGPAAQAEQRYQGDVNATTIAHADPRSFALAQPDIVNAEVLNKAYEAIAEPQYKNWNDALGQAITPQQMSDSVGKADDLAATAEPHAAEITKTNQDIQTLQDALGHLDPSFSGNTDEIGRLNTALGEFQGKLADLNNGFSDFLGNIQTEAAKIAAVGGDATKITDLADSAKAWDSVPGNHNSVPPDVLKSGKDAVLQYEEALPAVQSGADDMFNVEAQAKVAHTIGTDDVTLPYIKDEHSKNPEIAANAKASADAATEISNDFGPSAMSNPKDPNHDKALQDFAQLRTLNEQMSPVDSTAETGADKKFSSITDATASANAYNDLLKQGNVTLGEAKDYQDAYTEAQQASADKSISFQAALKQTIALINERNAATAESTQIETDHTNAEDAAVNAALLMGGQKAADLLTAQNKADDTPGLVHGSAEWQANVNSSLAADTDAADKPLNKTIYDLGQEQKQLTGPQDPYHVEAATLAQANPDADQETIDSAAKLTVQVNEEKAAITAAKEEHQAWTNTATQGFQSMDSALVSVIMRTQTWGQAFGDVAKQMASQIANLVIQQELLTPIEQMMGLVPGGGANISGGGVGSSGGLLGTVGGLLGAGGSGSAGGGLIGSLASGSSLMATAGDWLSGLFGGGGGMSTASLIAHQGGAAVESAAGSSLLSEAGSWISSFFADGGVSGAGVQGSIPLKMYAAGGVANNGPQMSIFGEAGPEAYVPLADGRSIPVTVSHTGGAGVSAPPAAGNMTNHFNVSVNTGAAPAGASSQQHAAMVGAEVSRQLEGMVVKVIQNQQRSGGILN